MFNFLIQLFFPSACMLITIFILWLIFEKMPQILNSLFGEHTVLVCGLSYSVIEKRRNFDNKLKSYVFYPELNPFYTKDYCGYVSECLTQYLNERGQNGL